MRIIRSFPFITLLALSFYFQSSESAKILFYFGSSIYSHKIAVWPLVLKLAEKGHQITFLSPPFPKDVDSQTSEIPNVTIYHPKSLILFWKEKEAKANTTRDKITARIKGFSDGKAYWDQAMQNALETCRVIFRSLEVQEWINTADFDLIVIDTPYNECGLGLAYKLAAPHILFGTSSLYMWHHELFGLPDETSWLPNYYYHFSTEMSFFQRVRNALTPLQWFYSTNRASYIIPQMEKLVRKSLNISEIPGFNELEKSASLFLLNTHFTQEYPRSLPPFVVPVGGMHLMHENVLKTQQLPQDVAEFIDEHGANGFVYVSFDILVELSRAPAQVIEKLLNAFIVLEMPVLWRWDDNLDKAPKERPKRVHITRWVPQAEILAHPKTLAFVTSGGWLSYQEAIYNAVPTLALPLTPEEDYNSGLIEKSKMGVKMDIGSFTQYKLTTNIRTLISDGTYRENARKISQLFKDRPQNPLETAVWWTEYVLRHKNLTFIKPLSIHQPWYERRLLDVWAFLAIMCFGTLIILVKVFNYMLCQKQNVPESKKRKAKMA